MGIPLIRSSIDDSDKNAVPLCRAAGFIQHPLAGKDPGLLNRILVTNGPMPAGSGFYFATGGGHVGFY